MKSCLHAHIEWDKNGIVVKSNTIGGMSANINIKVVIKARLHTLDGIIAKMQDKTQNLRANFDTAYPLSMSIGLVCTPATSIFEPFIVKDDGYFILADGKIFNVLRWVLLVNIKERK